MESEHRIAPRSADLQPGTKVRYVNGSTVVLGRRKVVEDYPEEDRRWFLDGWWFEGEECQRGLADEVIDDPEGPWEVVL